MNGINKTAGAFLLISFELGKLCAGNNHVGQIFRQLVNDDIAVIIVQIIAKVG